MRWPTGIELISSVSIAILVREISSSLFHPPRPGSAGRDCYAANGLATLPQVTSLYVATSLAGRHTFLLRSGNWVSIYRKQQLPRLKGQIDTCSFRSMRLCCSLPTSAARVCACASHRRAEVLCLDRLLDERSQTLLVANQHQPRLLRFRPGKRRV